MKNEVKILCPGRQCGRCKRLISRVQEAERISGRNNIITLVDSMDEISKFNTWVLPTLVINDQVVARGYAPSVKQQINMSMGCYGCRDATDILTGETVLGFPYKDFYLIAENLAFLNQKAIPDSRGKNAFALPKRKEAEKIELEDPLKN